jgi:hypothetical protein
MAVNIIKDISGVIYPAFNDSFITYGGTANGSVPILSKITIAPFTTPFIIFPDNNGEFQFNLKEIIKVNFNQNGFEDKGEVPVTFTDEIFDRVKDIEVEISLQNDLNISTIKPKYSFIKSVKQIGEKIFNNNMQLLTNSLNGINYNLTYFEGYPFFIELLEVDENGVITFKNKNVLNEVDFFGFTADNTLRVWIDKGYENLTTTNKFPLLDNVNQLEIYLNDDFKTNLNLKKVPAKCGVYLKWFNSNGGYSFYLFDEFYKESLSAKSIGEVVRNEFLNVGENPNSYSYTLGVESKSSLTIKTLADENEFEIIKDIISSPSVQMYSSKTPFESGEWFTVTISGNINKYNKKKFNEIKLNVELPERNNITF